MANTIFQDPIKSLVGKMSTNRENGYVVVHRSSFIGRDENNKPIYGPVQTYSYSLHQGEWSPAAVANRVLFRQANEQARLELKDDTLRAKWEALHKEHLTHCPASEHKYYRLHNFVAARIQAQLKSQSQK